eukprot:CAMPEP_0119464740 /NCGR_PEP_ID=MMETSP1344-20130328/203_1 /TAXON_ID=236787 /ORGANISM="Florenciella parvula, Strain CCMP2471" /LENGTH=52 /DNA_ID=CAMNT_0007496969 /DNA_START=56 /DNA_END=214 /DNA_ORIENTATION=+
MRKAEPCDPLVLRLEPPAERRRLAGSARCRANECVVASIAAVATVRSMLNGV